MNREIKFKGWNSIVGRMSDPMTLREIYETKRVQWHIIDWLQYTGLKDKNGVEIYESDVIQTPNGIGKVCFDEQYLHYFILYQYDSEALDIGFSQKIQIIGNIFEKPELLNTKNT